MALEQAIIPVPVPHQGRLHPAKAFDCEDSVDENNGNEISFNVIKPRIIIEEKPDKRRKASLRFEFQAKIMSDHEQYSQHWRRLWHVKLQLLLKVKHAVDLEVKPRSDEARRATVTKEDTRTNSVDLRAVGRFPTGAEAGVEVHMIRGGTLRVQQELQSWDCIQVFRKYNLRAKSSPQSCLRRLGTKFLELQQRKKKSEHGDQAEYCQEWHWTSNTDHYYETPDHHVFSRVVEVSKYLSEEPRWEELKYKFNAEASIREGGHGFSHLTRTKSRAPAERARKCHTIEKAPETFSFDIWPPVNQPQGYICVNQLPKGTTLDIGRICDVIKVKRSSGGWEPYPDGKFTAEDNQIQFDGNCVFDFSSLGQGTEERGDKSVRLLMTQPQSCVDELYKEAGKLREQIYTFRHYLRKRDHGLDELHKEAGELQKQLNEFRPHSSQERDSKEPGRGELCKEAGKLREQICIFQQRFLPERDRGFDGLYEEAWELQRQLMEFRLHYLQERDSKEFRLVELYKEAEKLREQIYTFNSLREKHRSLNDLYDEANDLQEQIYTFSFLWERSPGVDGLHKEAEKLREQIYTFNSRWERDHEFDGQYNEAGELREQIYMFRQRFLGMVS